MRVANPLDVRFDGSYRRGFSEYATPEREVVPPLERDASD
jgi:hypothetical protein